MAPPAKRLKRNVIPSSPRSDDLDTDRVPDSPLRQEGNANRASGPVIDLWSMPIEEASPFAQKPLKQAPSPTKTRQSTLRNSNAAPTLRPPPRTANTRSRSTTASASPEKKKRAPVKAEKGKNGNLFTFFSTQVNKQIASNTPPTSGTTKDEEDISTDDDDEIVETKVRQNTSFTSTATKRNRNALVGNGESNIVSSSQRFKKPSVSAPSKPKVEVEEDLRPWAERFAPQNLEELAVHTRKVGDVRGWLESVMSGQSRQRVLILKGAAGTGKTTTVQLVAKSMGSEVLEWRNPVSSMKDGEGGGFVSVTQQFEDFLGRGGKFGQLDILEESEVKTTKSEADIVLDRRKSLLLVEEFPNTFTKSSTVLQGFRSAILQYLAANTPSQVEYYSGLNSQTPVIPLVMVISENLLTTTSAAADSFTAHRLLGPEILHHPAVTIIEFNPIAPTFLQKALELVVLKESRKSGRRKTPGPLVLKRLGEIGDIRSAIGSLEFLCLQGDDADWGANISFAGGKGKKRTSKDTALTKMEEESLELVTRREASLGIFHAVGRVVYNKRKAGPSNEVLPSYLAKMMRPRKSEVVVEELMDETGTDTSTFLSALHENYVLSCNAVEKFPFNSDLDHVNACIDALSDADLMAPSWDGTFNPTGFGGGSGGRGAGGDVSRQDELSFQVAVRGILFGLPDPVTRKAPKEGGLRKGNGREGHQMFYPTSLKLWRKKEEIEGLVDMSVTKVMKGEQRPAAGGIIAGAAAFRRPKQGVETWTSSHSMAHPPRPTQHESSQAEKSADHIPLLVGLGGSAREEMLLERLPYLVKIAKAQARGKPSILLPLELPDLEKITKFTGIGAVKEDEEEERRPGDEVGVENWATDKPTEGGGSPRKTRTFTERGKLSGSRHDARMVAEQLEKTVLSDDDIED